MESNFGINHSITCFDRKKSALIREICGYDTLTTDNADFHRWGYQSNLK